MTETKNSKLLFLEIGHSNFGFVSDFDIRISDLDMTNHDLNITNLGEQRDD